MLDIAGYLDQWMLAIVSKLITLPEHDDDLVNHPHKNIITRLRGMQ